MSRSEGTTSRQAVAHALSVATYVEIRSQTPAATSYPAADRQIGEVIIRSDDVMVGYHIRPVETSIVSLTPG
jgi:long-subunit acyl-CoA synthetase (AMP-forming)